MRDKFAFQAWGKWGLYGVGYERDRGDVFWGRRRERMLVSWTSVDKYTKYGSESQEWNCSAKKWYI